MIGLGLSGGPARDGASGPGRGHGPGPTAGGAGGGHGRLLPARPARSPVALKVSKVRADSDGPGAGRRRPGRCSTKPETQAQGCGRGSESDSENTTDRDIASRLKRRSESPAVQVARLSHF